ncbi:nucleotide sugar dehydrogenase [Aureobasidium sp. EXF-10728]|nr:nucleotide sugar dehydrogenase [Aureobasidium sp. EXF-10728]
MFSDNNASQRSVTSESSGSSATSSPETPSTPLSPASPGGYPKMHPKDSRQDSATAIYDNFSPAVRTICCIGAGYVGGPTAAVIALKNPQITVHVADLNASRIQKWNSKHLPVYEPGLLDVVRLARDGAPESADAPSDAPSPRHPNLFFTTNVQESVENADLILMSVNTPTKTSGIGAGSATNLIALEGAMTSVAQWAKPGAIIVEKSTVPCRTAQMLRRILGIHRPGVPFEILSNPEFLAEGTAIKNLLNPDRILIGSAQTRDGLAAAEALKDVYAAWIPRARILTVNTWSSELAKVIANAMLAQRVSSMNSVSALCDATGADIDEIASAIGQDTRLGSKFLQAGLGFGGSCFKKDILNLVYMANTLNLPEVADYWMQVLHINDFQRDRFVASVVKTMNSSLVGKKLAIFGWAFKEDTNDTRESPAIEVVRSLLRESPRELVIYDPGCNTQKILAEAQELLAQPGQDLIGPSGPIRAVAEAFEACQNAHAVLILTPWEHFRYPMNPSQPDAFFDSIAQGDKICGQMAGLTTKFEVLAASASKKDGGEVECEAGCEDCLQADGVASKARTNVPWSRIAKVMKKPSWVFDARGLVDVVEMEKLGFKVERIGKVHPDSPLFGKISFPSFQNTPAARGFE